MTRWRAKENLPLLAIAAAKFVLNGAFLTQYDYFRDELYYIACSNHLAWGYVDQPPLSVAILAVTRALFGDSLVAIRLSAVLAGAVAVVVTGLTARRLGGGRWAQALAALAVALSPVVLGNAGRTFSMNAFDLLFWALAAHIAIVALNEQRPRLWMAFGAVAGLGLLNKVSMLFLGFGLVAGLLASRERRQLISPWFWAGGAVAAALVLPHIVWQQLNGWPTIEFMRHASQQKNVALAPLEFFTQQILMTGPAQAALWIGGLAWFARHPSAARLRAFAWLYPVIFAVMVANGAKAYYLTPVYFPFLAAGAVAFEGLTARATVRGRWRVAYVAALVALSAVLFPFAVPCLPVERFIAYSKALGVSPKAEERSVLEELPQYYADQFGWRELAAQVTGIHQRLTPEEQAHTVIYVRNYGEAAAIDFFGGRAGLPPASSPHNAYWFWGPSEDRPRVAIVMGSSRDLAANRADLDRPDRCGQVSLAAVTHCRYCMPFERGRQLFVCRDPKFSFRDIWPGERFFF